jgi:two-component system, cell cycle sensor histidine kinase and response regulator CckA
MKLPPRGCATQLPLHQFVPRTILLVEDEPFVREATRCILESAGFVVLPAEDANAALKVYEQAKGTINLVMTDMILPGRTGEQLGLELHQRSPHLKVLITSGYSNPEYALNNRQSNTHFLAKPYTRSDLIGKIAEIFEPAPFHHASGQAS